MGDEDQPAAAPPPQQTIVMPGPQQVAGDATQAAVDSFRKVIQEQLLPQYARQLTEIQREQAPQLNQINLEQQRQFGPQYAQTAIDILKQTDPTGFQMRQKLGEMTLADLGLGGALSPEETRLRQQDIRAGQVSRGVGTGFSDVLDEARYLGSERFNREQQRRANAASFLAGAPPQASFAALSGASRITPMGTQDVSGAAGSLFPSTNALIGNQASNFGHFADFTSRSNALNSSNYWAAQNQPGGKNPFLGALGGAVSGGTTGFMLGGPYGALAGGAAGGILGGLS